MVSLPTTAAVTNIQTSGRNRNAQTIVLMALAIFSFGTSACDPPKRTPPAPRFSPKIELDSSIKGQLKTWDLKFSGTYFTFKGKNVGSQRLDYLRATVLDANGIKLGSGLLTDSRLNPGEAAEFPVIGSIAKKERVRTIRIEPAYDR
jgi:hypothetical protein